MNYYNNKNNTINTIVTFSLLYLPPHITIKSLYFIVPTSDLPNQTVGRALILIVTARI